MNNIRVAVAPDIQETLRLHDDNENGNVSGLEQARGWRWRFPLKFNLTIVL